MKKNDQWFHFCMNMKGFNCFRDGKIVPKYILFWSGYTSRDIMRNATDVIVQKRPKRWK